jgi:hypothetical protein
MKHLQTYRLFESAESLTEEQKKFLNKFTMGSWSLNSQTGKVDVDGDFSCSLQNIEDLRGIRFGNVRGGFYCNFNQLTSLEGAPETVGKNFFCDTNRLTDLKGAPQSIGGNFYCNKNQLTSLEGAPETVKGSFYCQNNQLTSLEGAPEKVGGFFDCRNNQLTSLAGAPQYVGEDFYCDLFKTSDWTLEWKLEILKGKSEAAKTLIATSIPPEDLQQMIDENPTGMAFDLKGVWKDLKRVPGYEKLKFPPEYSEEAEMLSDLDDIGL